MNRAGRSIAASDADLSGSAARGWRARGEPLPWRSIPGPRGRRLMGCLAEVRNDRIAFVERAFDEFGDLVAFRMPGRRLLLLSHPRHFRHVLCDEPARYRKGLGLAEAEPLLGKGPLTSDDRLAARQRKRLRPPLCPARLESHLAVMVARTAAMVSAWEALATAGNEIDATEQLESLTLEILGEALLGIELRRRAPAVAHDLACVGDWAIARMASAFRLPLALPTPANRRCRRALGRLEALGRRILDDRRQRPGPGDDLLQRILSAEAEEADAELSLRELLTFLLAGHETTAATLAWTCQLLALHPDAQERLHREVTATLGDRTPSIADLGKLVFTKAVVNEVLRLYPPIWMITRRSRQPDRIDGFAVPAGTDVLLSVRTLHRHPAFWSRPHRFETARFQDSGAERPANGRFLPFGAGDRACLGGRFAMVEALVVVALLARRFHLRLAGPPAAPSASLTLKPGSPVRLRLSLRHARHRPASRS